MKPTIRIGLAAVLGGTLAVAPVAASRALPDPIVSPQRGGGTTRVIATDKAFTFPLANLPPDVERPFFLGNRVFNTNWITAPGSVAGFDGLGPAFNRVSCSGCHLRDGRGRPPEGPNAPLLSMLVRLSVPGPEPKDAPVPHPAYGDQINDRAIVGVEPEGRVRITYQEIAGRYGDGTPYTLLKPVLQVTDLAFGPLGDGAMLSARTAPHMIGLGLLEAVPEETIMAYADPDDADGDGISGRPNRVPDPLTGGTVLGRFGWKANMPGLRVQSAAAAFGDIGLTSHMFPDENCPPVQARCAAAPRGTDGPDLSDRLLDALVLYSGALAVPAQRAPDDPAVRRGGQLFVDSGCAACHRPTLQTGDFPFAPLADQTIHPFTDLLLHDMGEGLADGRPDHYATGREWRTAPLWGIGLVETVNGHTRFLHDGRARNLAEAILWHGGEAEAAREAFRLLPADSRADLLAFLNSL